MARYRFMTLWLVLVTAAICLHSVSTIADESIGFDYRTQAGDVLQIGVWQEPDLNLEVIVRPDGGFSLPLIGEVTAKGRTIAELRKELMDRFGKLIPDTDVFVAVRQLSGNKIYLIGKVARPGEFVINRHIDVMQALSMAGGTTVFADVNDIKILRRVGDKQQVLNFQYGEVERGMSLEQNILLKSGDIVVVP